MKTFQAYLEESHPDFEIDEGLRDWAKGAVLGAAGLGAAIGGYSQLAPKSSPQMQNGDGQPATQQNQNIEDDSNPNANASKYLGKKSVAPSSRLKQRVRDAGGAKPYFHKKHIAGTGDPADSNSNSASATDASKFIR